MKFFTGKFLHRGKALESAPLWAMTTIEAGTMRFRWNETNGLRADFFSSVFKDSRTVVQPELIHSRTVYEVSSADDIFLKKGDGVLTSNAALVPSVTVADCMPIFLYDTSTGIFGVLHSGWKGTGIASRAVEMLAGRYGSKPEDICFVLGPHIHSCCYSVDEERALYFSRQFGSGCVAPLKENLFSLSLARANLFLLESMGVPADNILVSGECTCCFRENGKFKYGSFRRQTADIPPEVSLEERSLRFTVQAAFVFAQ
ncbi:polyphenol oxidase family protein [Treponema sp.]|uniref:polyphenol oxidase family protein n=1 Tax=Treponema sp. TaxID=166 RepID=UPI003F0F5EEF